MYRKLAILEPLNVFGLIMAYIWGLRATHPNLWMAILGLMLLSHLLRRESPGKLGFRGRSLRNLAAEYAPVLAFLVLLTLAGGTLLGTIRPVNFDAAFAAFAAYLPWGLVQQYILNGYFLNRFDAVLSPRRATMAAVTLFCGAHAPNWFLMAVTLAGGYCSVRLYRQYHSLFFLGLAHAIIGFLIFVAVPDSITHHLRVGPGWFNW